MMGERSRFLWRAYRSRFRDHRAELSAIRSHIKPSAVVIDVGANKGSFLYWLSRWNRPGHVVAFEPQLDLANYLKRICLAMELPNVTVEAKAVFSEAGDRDFFIPLGHQPGASLLKQGLSYAKVEAVRVPVVALDDYFSPADQISILKVDVEGAEVAVFEGADRILRTNAPLLVFECESRHLGDRRIGEVFHHLEKIGYSGFFIRRGRALPVSQFRENVHQPRSGEWFWKRPGYCSNFIFCVDH